MELLKSGPYISIKARNSETLNYVNYWWALGALTYKLLKIFQRPSSVLRTYSHWQRLTESLCWWPICLSHKTWPSKSPSAILKEGQRAPGNMMHPERVCSSDRCKTITSHLNINGLKQFGNSLSHFLFWSSKRMLSSLALTLLVIF